VEHSQPSEIQQSPELHSGSGFPRTRADSYEADFVKRFRKIRNLNNALKHHSREKLVSNVWGKSKKSRRWEVVQSEIVSASLPRHMAA
jgi:hypothetical protein